MPKVTVYVREDDYEKWKQIQNKSELLSLAINRSEAPVNEITVKDIPEEKIREVQAAKNLAYCGFGHAIPVGRTKCLGKGCKYGG